MKPHRQQNAEQIRDRSKHKQAEARVKNLAIFPSENPYPVLCLSKDGTILYANAASASLLGEWGVKIGAVAPDYWHKLAGRTFKSNQTEKNIELEHRGRTLSFTAVPIAGAECVNLYGFDVTEHKKTEQEKGKLLHAIGERVKELNCLYAIAKTAAVPDVSLGELCQKTAEIIPPSWQYPEITCARILIHDQEYETANFKKTKWLQAADIIEYGNKAGTVEVYYLEEVPVLYEGPFLKEERDLIEGIAERLGNFIERKQTEERARKTKVLNAINEVFIETLRCETDEELGQTCLDVAERLTESKFGFMGDLNDKKLSDSFAISNPGWDACEIKEEQAKRVIFDMPLKGIDRGAMLEGCSRIVNGQETIENHPEHVKMPEGHPTMTSFLGVPFIRGGEVIGMIGLGNKEGGYTFEDQENIEALSIAIIEALRSKRSGVQLQRSLETNLITEQIASMGSWEWDLQSNKVILSENSLELFRIKPEMFDGELETLLLRVHPDDRKEFRKKTEEMISSKVPQDIEYRVLRPDGSERVFKSINKKYFDDQGNVRRIMGATQDITERKRTEERMRQAKELSDTLNELNSEIVSTLDFDEIVRRVLDQSTKALGMDLAALYILEDGYWKLSYGAGLEETALGTKNNMDEAPFSIHMEEADKFAVSDIKNKSIHCDLIGNERVKHVISSPLTVKDAAFGIMMYGSRDKNFEATDLQIDFASKLTISLSLAAETSRLYAKEHKIAAALQEAQLKMPEKLDGIDFGYIYRSATIEEAEVGGDFYDLFELDEDHIAITLGDISGKGLEAATLTSVVKTCLRGFSYQGFSPAGVLENTNSVISKTAPTRSFLTAFFGILEKSTGLLRYCSAGHWPGLIKRKTDIRKLNGENTALGVTDDAKYQGDETTIGRDDTLILYTDGIVEARKDSAFYSEERLIKVAKKLKQADSKKLARALFDDVASFSNHIFADDLAILIVSLASTK